MAKRKVKIAGAVTELDLARYQEAEASFPVSGGGGLKVVSLKPADFIISSGSLTGIHLDGKNLDVKNYHKDGAKEQIELSGGVILTAKPPKTAGGAGSHKPSVSEVAELDLGIEFDPEKIQVQLKRIKTAVEAFGAVVAADPQDYLKTLKKYDQEYGQILNKLIWQKTAAGKTMLAELFNDLASLQIKLGHFNKDVSYYNNAAIRATYALSIAEKLEDPVKSKSIAEKATGQLKRVQESLLRAIGVSDDDTITAELAQSPEELANKNILEDLRGYSSKKIAEGVSDFQPVFKTIAGGMRYYLYTLFAEAEEVIGKPPCKYAVIGLGSMALKQLTPYSDLEFAILTAKNLPPKSPERDYFKKLSYYVHFKVICLGETIVPTSDYGIDLSSLVKQGVNFDLGGKTPLGRHDKPYDLVQSVKGMLWYVKNQSDGAEHRDKALPYILELSCHVHGTKELVMSYQERVRKFLSKDCEDGSGRSNSELRAIKTLMQGTMEIDYLGLGAKGMKGNLESYSFQSFAAAGKLFNVKQEIYRIPDRFIYDLGMIHSIQGTVAGLYGLSAWEIVEQLELGKVINPEAASHLKACVNFATSLRLKTYTHYGRQKDTMDFWPKIKEESDVTPELASQMFGLAKEDLSEDGALFEFYYTALPLMKRLNDYCNTADKQKAKELSISAVNKQNFFVTEIFYDCSLGTKAQVNLRLLKYQESLNNNLEKLKELEGAGKKQSEDYVILLNNIGFVCNELDKHKKALNYQKAALKLVKKLPSDTHLQPQCAAILDNIGGTYTSLGQHRTALKYQKQALKLRKLGDNADQDYGYALSLNNLGNTYRELGNYKKTLSLQLESQALREKIFGTKHESYAAILNNLSVTYSHLGDYTEALKCQEKALILRKDLMGENNPRYIIALSNIAETCRELGKYAEALNYQKKVLTLSEKVFGNKHSQSAHSLNNIAVTYSDMGNYSEALKYHLTALELLKEVLGEKHPDYATSLNNVGEAYRELGNHSEALKYLLEALKLTKEVLGEKHPDYAVALGNIAEAYRNLGDYQEALKYHKQSVVLFKELLGGEHPLYINSLSNIASMYGALGNHQEALKCKREVLTLTKKIFGEKHANTARSLNNLGSTYEAIGNYTEALKYKLEALKICKEVLGEKHPNYAASLNNVASTYRELGNHTEALKYQLEALHLRKQVLGDKHPDYADSLNNVGATYGDLGKHKAALKYKLEALHLRKQVLGEKHPYYADSLNNVGATYGELGDYTKALKYLLEALELRKEVLGEKHPDYATSLNNVGSIYAELGNHHEALKYELEALKLTKEVLGEKHPDVTNCLNSIGVTYGKLGNYTESLKYKQEALKLTKELRGKKHPHYATSIGNVGCTYSDLGNHTEALKYLLKALNLTKEVLGEKHPYYASILSNVGLTYRNLNNYTEALKYLLKALNLTKEVLGEKHPYYASILSNVDATTKIIYKKALEQFKQGNFTEALKRQLLWETALDQAGIFIWSKEQVVDLYMGIVMVYGALGRADKQLEYIGKGLKAGEQYRAFEAQQAKKLAKEDAHDMHPVIDPAAKDFKDAGLALEKSLKRQITNLEDIPPKKQTDLRVVSYNITTDFFDKSDTTPDKHHQWSFRSEYVTKMLVQTGADVLCLQELSPDQGLYLAKSLLHEYHAIFLSQTPSEVVPAGSITYGLVIDSWVGKFIGTRLIATFVNKSKWKIIKEEIGRFWLNEKPDEVPTSTDRGGVDKGFGNMNTYRAVLWVKLQNDAGKSVYVFNSHYPLSGNSKTRFKCAELEMAQIKKIAKDSDWISAGDRNLIEDGSDGREYNPKTIYNALVKRDYDIRDGAKHYGISTTWLGFSYDPHKMPVAGTDEGSITVLDVIVTSRPPARSFCHPGAFAPAKKSLFALAELTPEELAKQNEGRYFASDHAMLGGDINFD